MNNRNEIDKKNILNVKKILKDYPKETMGYINSLSSKTSYTKVVYARYIAKFINYIRMRYNYEIYDEINYSLIKPMDIDEYMEHIKYKDGNIEKSASFRTGNLAAIKGFFKFLMINDLIQSNPTINIETPKDKNEHEIVTISDDDLKIMIYNIRHKKGVYGSEKLREKWASRDIAILVLGVTTGLRISAIVGIDIDDIYLNEGYIKVTEKGNINKNVYIGEKTSKVLSHWIEERKFLVKENEKALFISRGSKRISVQSIERKIKIISEETGKNITPHKMRSTCATRLYEKTGDIYLVQQQLGHKNINNTERYAKVSEKKRIEAANILDSLYI